MNTLVANIEQKTRELVALCEMHKQLKAVAGQLPAVADNEINRLWVQAQNHYTDGCELAIKAALALSDEPIA